MFLTVTLALLQGMGELLKIFFLTLLFSLPLGLVIAFALRSRCKPVSWLFNVIVWIIRGTPLMLQLIIIFYGPGKWFNNNIWGYFSDGRMAACVIAFVINYAAYFAEIFRGGLQSIPRGQREAGKALGFSRVQIFFRILLPQLFKRSLLPVSNEVVTLVKDTALVTCIALCDMYYYAKKATSATGSLLPLFLAGAFYLLMNTVVEVVFDRLNKRMNYYRG